MGIFKKEPDMKCWSCQHLINHKKVHWKPRKFIPNVKELLISFGIE